MKIVKAIFGGTFLLIAFGCLIQLALLLMSRSDQATTQGGAAANTLKWAFFLVLSGGAAAFFLYSAFRRPRFGTPVNPPL